MSRTTLTLMLTYRLNHGYRAGMLQYEPSIIEGGKITPEVISRIAKVPWVNHFVAQEAREYCSYGY